MPAGQGHRRQSEPSRRGENHRDVAIGGYRERQDGEGRVLLLRSERGGCLPRGPRPVFAPIRGHPEDGNLDGHRRPEQHHPGRVRPERAREGFDVARVRSRLVLDAPGPTVLPGLTSGPSARPRRDRALVDLRDDRALQLCAFRADHARRFPRVRIRGPTRTQYHRLRGDRDRPDSAVWVPSGQADLGSASQTWTRADPTTGRHDWVVARSRSSTPSS